MNPTLVEKIVFSLLHSVSFVPFVIQYFHFFYPFTNILKNKTIFLTLVGLSRYLSKKKRLFVSLTGKNRISNLEGKQNRPKEGVLSWRAGEFFFFFFSFLTVRGLLVQICYSTVQGVSSTKKGTRRDQGQKKCVTM